MQFNDTLPGGRFSVNLGRKICVIIIAAMRKKKFVPPVVRKTTSLELESAILGTSQIFSPMIQDTGHETKDFTTSTYWEDE